VIELRASSDHRPRELVRGRVERRCGGGGERLAETLVAHELEPAGEPHARRRASDRPDQVLVCPQLPAEGGNQNRVERRVGAKAALDQLELHHRARDHLEVPLLGELAGARPNRIPGAPAEAHVGAVQRDEVGDEETLPGELPDGLPSLAFGDCDGEEGSDDADAQHAASRAPSHVRLRHYVTYSTDSRASNVQKDGCP
jgi:hypothetical protein